MKFLQKLIEQKRIIIITKNFYKIAVGEYFVIKESCFPHMVDTLCRKEGTYELMHIKSGAVYKVGEWIGLEKSVLDTVYVEFKITSKPTFTELEQGQVIKVVNTGDLYKITGIEADDGSLWMINVKTFSELKTSSLKDYDFEVMKVK